MATIGPVIVSLRVNARSVKVVAWSLYPLVWLGIMTPERAVAFGVRFLRVEARVEGWGGN